MRPSVRLVAWAVAFVALAAPARAELVFFASGRALSVKSYAVDGDSLVLTLRTGGQIICERAVITRIEPDEVPYPEPPLEAERRPVPASTVAAIVPAAPFTPYGDLIDRFASEQNVSAQVVRAVIKVESNYQERARSRKGAMGLMQLMPETARRYAVADPYEPRSNIEAGIKHLRSLLDRFELPLALAAYNAGEAAVLRFGGIPPYPETQTYVQRVLSSILP
jgi:soluble lytic murein transglycosylase-like protein